MLGSGDGRTDWSERLYWLVSTLSGVALALLAADRLGFQLSRRVQRWRDEAAERWRRTEFEAFYTYVWPLRRREHDGESR